MSGLASMAAPGLAPAGAPHARVLAAADPTLASFYHQPWWLVVIKVLFVFLFLMLMTLFAIWAERRIIGRMQQRPGPNRAGPFGLLQSLLDGVKLPLKEDIVPTNVDKLLFWLAPAIAVIPAFISIAIIPFGPLVSIFGVQTPLQLADLPVAVLLVLAMSSMAVYGLVLAGWASESPYPLLGGLRSSAQVISYEIAMGLAFVPVFLYAHSLSTTQIVAAQSGANTSFHLFGAVLHWPSWFAVLLFPSFVIYLITMVGETNRLPFDLPEGEGELVGGYHTEYSSLKFALFYLGEYINMVTVSALATTLFLGGWRAPWPISVWPDANTGWYPLIWFLAKVLILLFCFVWLRGTLPRIRYDQLMRFGWKVLIPVALVWILVIATIGSGARTVAARRSTPWPACWSSRSSPCCSWGTRRRSGVPRPLRKPPRPPRRPARASQVRTTAARASRFRRWTCRTTTGSGWTCRPRRSPRRNLASPGPRRRR